MNIPRLTEHEQVLANELSAGHTITPVDHADQMIVDELVAVCKHYKARLDEAEALLAKYKPQPYQNYTNT